MNLKTPDKEDDERGANEPETDKMSNYTSKKQQGKTGVWRGGKIF